VRGELKPFFVIFLCSSSLFSFSFVIKKLLQIPFSSIPLAKKKLLHSLSFFFLFLRLRFVFVFVFVFVFSTSCFLRQSNTDTIHILCQFAPSGWLQLAVLGHRSDVGLLGDKLHSEADSVLGLLLRLGLCLLGLCLLGLLSFLGLLGILGGLGELVRGSSVEVLVLDHHHKLLEALSPEGAGGDKGEVLGHGVTFEGREEGLSLLIVGGACNDELAVLVGVGQGIDGVGNAPHVPVFVRVHAQAEEDNISWKENNNKKKRSGQEVVTRRRSGQALLLLLLCLFVWLTCFESCVECGPVGRPSSGAHDLVEREGVAVLSLGDTRALVLARPVVRAI